MRYSVAGLLFMALAAGPALSEEILRPPVAAGSFYPDNPQALMDTIHGFYSATVTAPLPGKIVALIVPHSGYEFSGQIAAQAFELLQPGQYQRVIILAPAHFVAFENCSIPIASAFVTPFGVVPLDGEAIERLTLSTLVSTRALHYGDKRRKPLHESEHSIEVLLPFLQERLGLFKLVPILVGSLNDAHGNFNPNSVVAVADALKTIIDERTLLIVSSDFTHFGNDFSFRPFNDNILANIQQLDEDAFRLIARRDSEHLQKYVEKTGITICGEMAIQVLMKALPAHTVGRVLAYDLSARKTGNQDRSVSYGALAFADPTAAVPETKVEPNPLAIPLARLPGGGATVVDAAPAEPQTPAPAPEAPVSAPSTPR